MDQAISATRFACRTRPQALATLAVTAAALAWCMAAYLNRPTVPITSSGGSGGEDLRLYRRIAERVRAGANYHDAAGDELRRRGYPTGSVFNWRPPTYAWVLGAALGPLGGQVLLIAIVIAALLTAYTVERREGGRGRATAVVVLMVGAFLWCVDGDAFFAQELWAAALIALSVGGYALGRWHLGLATGLLALFFRELALPYALIAAFLAFRQGRRREAVLWAVGLALYAVFMVYHGMEVLRRITPADRVEADGWVQFGGARFLLSACGMNVLLFRLPAWVAAFYLVFSLLGLAGWRGETAARVGLTAFAYTAAFAIIGKPYNCYWGLLFAPLLPFGLVRAPAALRDLFGALRIATIRRAGVSPSVVRVSSGD
ncbi:MAG TPA: hypothetical protein VNK04_19920 [Gemmataceae bacterium]|nr:hypothetical protein [Gemmataceae bacterium]